MAQVLQFPRLASYTSEPIICLACGTGEVLHMHGDDDGQCMQCGEWQMEFAALRDVYNDYYDTCERINRAPLQFSAWRDSLKAVHNG